MSRSAAATKARSVRRSQRPRSGSRLFAEASMAALTTPRPARWQEPGSKQRATDDFDSYHAILGRCAAATGASWFRSPPGFARCGVLQRAARARLLRMDEAYTRGATP